MARAERKKPAPRKVQAEEGNRRAELIRVAGRLFVDQGFEATTIRDIAERAKVSIGLIYQYVEDKEDVLFLALCEVLEILRVFTLGKAERVEVARAPSPWRIGTCRLTPLISDFPEWIAVKIVERPLGRFLAFRRHGTFLARVRGNRDGFINCVRSRFYCKTRAKSSHGLSVYCNGAV